MLKHPRPVIDPEWMAPGAFGCPLDYDSYWKAEAFEGVDRLFGDDVAQIQYTRTHKGHFPSLPDNIAELAHVVAGKAEGRRSAEERIISIHLGLALEDMATAARLLQLAESRGVGTMLPL